ncbi:MAG TPA: hypothetical protein PKM50_02585 [Methanoregula sp.]|nr:hypothetical protein [Methanoregula sp.]
MENAVAEKIISRVFSQLGFSKINMNDFQDRLKYQKLVYLMQNFGLSLGYGYSWYVRGPYSPELTKALFTISNNPALFTEGSQIKFKDETEVIKRIDNFRGLLGSDLSDPVFLEVLASMVFIKKAYCSKKLGEDDLKTLLLSLKPRLKHEENIEAILQRACSKVSNFN